ncbi:Ig-like domain-containing protein [Motilibacter aurantiacus]|uniref:Ig-like domain-containing protein n=1 Tax=Motilibacter aurantiacus TaxID=2714955 RepID=UPI00140E551D|nr:Ig-like domain-containing protein [Motilibacter aurantiacus]NHC47369.1 Ig-like domain repeat protein [Motilibacter aurantiacus]
MDDGRASLSGSFPQGFWEVVAEFAPSDAAYTPSASAPRPVTVLPYPLRLDVTPTTAPLGGPVTLEATGEWPFAAGTLRFYAGDTEVASTQVALPRGTVSLPVTLAAGNHRLWARFTPAGLAQPLTSNSIYYSVPAAAGPAAVAVTPVTGLRFPQGRPLSAVVATVDAPGVPVSSLSAVIDWGDGTTSPGVVAGPAGRPAVFATHSFAVAPSSMVNVSVIGPDGRYYYNGPVSVAVG